MALCAANVEGSTVMPLSLIAYISEYAGTPERVDRDIEDIRRVAKRFNGDCGISGVLFFLNNRFMQVLEGEAGILAQLMGRIEKDSRHRQLSYLLNVPIEKKELADWNMDTFNLAKTDVFRSETIQAITQVYTANIKPDAESFVSLVEEMLNDPDISRIVNL